MWPVHAILVLIPSVNGEGLDESAHMHTLVGTFPANMYKLWM